MTKTLAILEDNADRQQAMRSALVVALPDATCVFFNSAHAMIAWLPDHLDSVSLISLDHDLELLRGLDGQQIDPGDGRDVARFLATQTPCCPVIVHTSNSLGASSMTCTLQDAGWNVERVFPEGDIAWVTERWKPAVLRHLPRQKLVLGRDEAAALAVFDPQDGRTLREIQVVADSATELAAGVSIDPRFSAILAAVKSPESRRCPWSLPPRYADRVLVLRLRQSRMGNAAPLVRQTAADSGLAVLDLLTDLVFAPEELQASFESPEWREGALPPAHWLQAGCFLLHSTFGEGRVLDIGTYKTRRVFVVRFNDRERVLDMEHGLPHVRPRSTPGY